MKISVILPCRNEENAIGYCIDVVKETLSGRDFEIIVSDSSEDASAEIARSHGAKVVKHRIGYGDAYIEGLNAASGDVIVMGDSDATYDFSQIPQFLKAIDDGNDLVLGSRFLGSIKKGAMPALHRYVGNPLLSLILSILFGRRITDAHSGFRAIRRDALLRLDLHTRGMEFASEMIIKAIKQGLRIAEIPITYSPRIGSSKLKSFNDGWKHLRFMLLWSPDYVFLIPGLFLSLLGTLLLVSFLIGKVTLFGIRFDIHPMFAGSVLLVLGYQTILSWVFAKIYATVHLGDNSRFTEKLLSVINLEKSLILGSIVILAGLSVNLLILMEWVETGFGALNTLRGAIFASTIMILGIQTLFSSFLISVLGIKS